MKKIINWFKARKPSKRKLIQLYAALLFNANLKGFASGEIYKGPAKNICTPGLNCYSCPAASGACPLGSLQNSIVSSNRSTLYYVVGIILLYGMLFGRWICGFLCPFGLIQELLHKIPTPKIRKSKFTRILSYFKYVILVFFALIVPVAYAFRKFPLPGFCKYICPAGTLEGAMGLLSNSVNTGYLRMLGPLFTWKFMLMVSILVICVFMFRFFCRFLCPLGAIYGLFNKISFVGVKVDKKSCTDCGICVNKCKMDINHVGDHECISCGECISVCPTKAIQWKGGRFMIDPEDVAPLSANAGADDIEEYESKIADNRRIKKRNTVIKAAIAIAMITSLAAVLIYFNFIDGKADPNPSIPTPEVTDGESQSEDDSTQAVRPPEGSSVGNSLPALTLDIVGSDEKFSTRENLGKVTVLNFWYTTCGPCVEELPHFNEVANEMPDQITVVAIHVDQPWVNVSQWVADTHPEWNEGEMIIAYDTGYVAQSLFSIQACPVTVVIDPNGVITDIFIGSLSRDELVEAIDKAIGK